MAKKEIIHPPVKMMTGCEMFMWGDEPQGFSMRDFWSVMYSNIYENTGDLAEFLVAVALNIRTFKKYGWTQYDIDYRDCRIEVKATQYYQPWEANGKVTEQRTFNIGMANSVEGDNDSGKMHNNDVYVFVLNTGRNEKDSYPLELNHWLFWVVPTSDINKECGNQKKLSLNKLKKIANEVGGGDKGLGFCDLKKAIDEIISKYVLK